MKSRELCGNPPAVPVGGIVPHFGGTVPSGFALPQGQNLPATAFPAANAVLGPTYGNPGGGNFTTPDLRGRGMVALDAGGSGRITGSGGNWDGTVLGNAGGTQSRIIAQNQLPNVTPTFARTPATITSNQSDVGNYNTGVGFGPAGTGNVGAIVFPSLNNLRVWNVTASYTPAGTVLSINGGVSQQQVAMMPPSMSVNVMMRIA